MRNVVLGVVRKIMQTYYIEKSYSITYYFDITNLLYYRSFTKETFKKTYYPILFSWEQKSMFSCWAVKTKPIAVKYVKNRKALIA